MTVASEAFARVLETSILRLALDDSDKSHFGSLGFILRRYPAHVATLRR